MSDRRQITLREFIAEGEKRFGEDRRKWLFLCPSCGTVQSSEDFRSVGQSDKEINRNIAFSCIGRFDETKGCDWTLGGLLRIHTLEVLPPDGGDPQPYFEFAQPQGDGE